MKSTLRIVILVFTLASTGTGTSGADSLGPSLSPSSLTFASQIVGTTSGAQAVTLTNSSGAPLSISSILAFSVGRNQQPDFAQTNNCGSSLAASSACTIN